MGYDFSPRNKAAGDFRLGAFSFPVLLEACNYLFPCIHKGGKWYRVIGIDERLSNEEYPEILCNGGFRVTAEEARWMARIARNYVAIQKTLPEENVSRGLIDKGSITRDDLMAALQSTLHGESISEPWPLKIRADFTDKFEEFATWAEKSGGFRIY